MLEKRNIVIDAGKMGLEYERSAFLFHLKMGRKFLWKGVMDLSEVELLLLLLANVLIFKMRMYVPIQVKYHGLPVEVCHVVPLKLLQHSLHTRV